VPVGTRIGIGVGVAFGVLLLALVAFLVWFWRRRRRAQQGVPAPLQETYNQPYQGQYMMMDQYKPVYYAQVPVEAQAESAAYELPAQREAHELSVPTAGGYKYA
jgi:hypothetical protein